MHVASTASWLLNVCRTGIVNRDRSYSAGFKIQKTKRGPCSCRYASESPFSFEPKHLLPIPLAVAREARRGLRGPGFPFPAVRGDGLRSRA